MSNYHRLRITGACYFFTVVTWRRMAIFNDAARVQILRDALRKVKETRPFQIDAFVVLPDHLHCIWQMPDDDADYSSRWREIKKAVSRQIDTTTNARHERLIWQRRFWEHVIRDGKRLAATHGLHPLQSGQTRISPTAGTMAVVIVRQCHK